MYDSVFPLIDTLIRKTLLIYSVAVRMEQEHLETLVVIKVRELNKCVPHLTFFLMQLMNDCINKLLTNLSVVLYLFCLSERSMI